ncbi:MAG: NAD kinase [Pseudohongiella sp.]|nr:MAG: NAD kinase [Pseudohongiella sp.]
MVERDSQIRMAKGLAMAEFNSIGLVGRPGHAGAVDTLRRLLDFLSGKDLEIFVDDLTAELISGHGQKQCTRDQLSKFCDLVIVVGGDGSMLNVAKFVASDQVPVIGINRGRLGFLTDILPGELEEGITAVLEGNYSVDSRFLLDVVARTKSSPGSEETYLGSALNDVVLHPGKAAQMIKFELFVDDCFVYSIDSDGLIVATPTGSTAYALSAGGPIMHPGLNAVVLVPMYPHSLGNRPLVVDGDSEIRIVVSAQETLEPQLSCDGQILYTASAGDEIIVRKKGVPLKLIHPPEHTFYQACRSKLGWGSRLVRDDD